MPWNFIWKSFLSCCGVKDKGLRGLGHDLVAALAECERHGLNSYVTISTEDLELVKRVNLCYEKKELEYFVGKAKSLGSIDDFTYLVSRVSKALFNPLTEASFRSFGQDDESAPP